MIERTRSREHGDYASNLAMLLATPAGFRPTHLEYAVLKGVNAFMEKSFEVDAPGVRRVLRAGYPPSPSRRSPAAKAPASRGALQTLRA